MIKKVITSILVVLIILALLPAPAVAVPQPPHVFRGAVTVGEAPAANGLTVTAAIAGATFPYSVSASTSGGRYGDDLQFKVPSDDADTGTKEGGVDGDTVILYVQGVQAGTSTFVVGEVSVVNLSITALPTIAAPTNVQRTTPTNDNTPTFTWNAVTGAISYQLRKDSDAFSSVGNVTSYTFGTIADGAHSFEVRGVDAQGNPGPSSTLLSFTIDITPPTVTITALTPDPTTDTTPTFSGNAIDATTTVASVQYRVDGGAWTAATAVDGTFDEASEAYIFTTSELAAGSHTVQVRATDAAGNVVLEANYASDTFEVTVAAPVLPPAAPPPVSVEELVGMAPTAAAAALEAMTTTQAVIRVEQIATENIGKAVEIVKELTTEKAVEILEKIAIDKAVEIVGKVATEKAIEILGKMATEKAAEIVGKITTEKAFEILDKVAIDKVVNIIEKVATEKAAAVVEKMTTSKVADILQKVTVEKAAAIMEKVTTEKLTEVIAVMSEKALVERLPQLSAEKLYSIPPAVLFKSLPNVPTEQIVGEVPPKPPPDLPAPVVVYVTPTGAEYLAIRTVAGEWVVVMGTPIPVDKLLIKTKRALQNVKTILKLSDEMPAEAKVKLPTELKILTYVDISFENAKPEDIELGHLTFKVEKKWLQQNSLHRWSVALQRYDSALNQWVPLPTKRVKEDDTYVYYTVIVTRFSVFAITGSQTLLPVEFKLSNLSIKPTEVLPGETVTISADITNLSSKAETYPAILWINSTAEVGQDISLKAGETKPLSFTVTRTTEGKYEVRLDRLIGSFNVTKVVKPPVPPTPPPPPPPVPPPTVPPPVTPPPPPPPVPPPPTPPVPPPTVPPPVTPVPPPPPPPNWWLIVGIIAVVVIIGIIAWRVFGRRGS